MRHGLAALYGLGMTNIGLDMTGSAPTTDRHAPDDTAARVGTIVLNYRNIEDTIRCVEALRMSDFLDQRILVVDNAQDGPATAALRDQLEPGITVLASGDNLGYAGGNNYGIKWALQWQPEFVWLVNPDAVAKPNTLSGLVRAADAHPDAGIVGCRMLQGGSRPARIESNGGTLDPARWGAAPKRDTGRFDGEVTETGVRAVDWVSGACFLVRTALIDDVGLLPEEYFLYYEDTDYCLRAQRAGWRTVVTPGTRMWHFRRSSGDLPSASYVYYVCRNRIHFGMRHFNATVDDVVGQLDRFVQRWRTRVEHHAPELLGAYDEIVRMAVADARAGRLGRATELESIPFSPKRATSTGEVAQLTEVLERERRQRARDAKRLLARIKQDSAEVSRVRKLERALERERRHRAGVEAKLRALRSSRSFRVGRVIGRLARPVAAARSIVRRRAVK